MGKIGDYLQEIFYCLSIALSVFVVLEIFKPKIVLVYFNLSFLLILWILVAIILLLTKKNG